MNKFFTALSLSLFVTQLFSQGFPATASNWATPSGGQIYEGVNQGFNMISDNNVIYEDEGSQMWDYMDMNGDQKPDLVVTSHITGGVLKTFGSGSTYWKVFLNTGSGFSNMGNVWSLPAGGQIYDGVVQGFTQMSDNNVIYEDEESQMWTCMDMNGDQKPDLVVTSHITGGVLKTFGSGTTYWKVFLNTGSGFSGTATTWATPAGGQIYDGVTQGFIMSSDNNVIYEDETSQMWSSVDMNGDNKPDLIVTSRIAGGALRVFDSGGPVWKVFLNTGSGFSTVATNWSTPAGGQIYDGIAQGFIQISDNDVIYEDESSQMWNCMDMNGDSKPDLVVTSRIASGVLQVYSNAGPVWKVYLNTSSGFSNTASNWSTPSGGQIYDGVTQGFTMASDNNVIYEDEGSQMWSCMDIDGDEKPDLVVTSRISGGTLQAFGSGTHYWKVYVNNGSGFSSTATNWSTPSGGQIYDGITQGFTQISDNNVIYEDESSQAWTCSDINGDGKADLIVTSQISGGKLLTFNSGGPYWKVYLNSSTLGTHELDMSLSATEIYPNPCSGNLTLKVESRLVSKKYIILNPLGEEILSGRISGELTPVSLEEIPGGIYFLQIEGENLLTRIAKQ